MRYPIKMIREVQMENGRVSVRSWSIMDYPGVVLILEESDSERIVEHDSTPDSLRPRPAHSDCSSGGSQPKSQGFRPDHL